MAASGSGRLAWKLWRETRWWLALLVVVPAVGFPLAASIPETSSGWQILRLLVVYPTAYLVPALAGILAARLAQEDWGAGAYTPSHLPLAAPDVLKASFLLPLVVAALLGLWTGWCSLPGAMHHYAGVFAYCCQWSALTTGCFAMGYVVSAASTKHAGAIYPAMAGNIGPAVLLAFRDRLNHGLDMLPSDPGEWLLVAAFVVAPIVATFVWAASRRKQRFWRQWAAFVAGVLALFVCASPAVWVAWAGGFPGAGFPPFLSEDGSLIVSMTGQFSGRAASGTYCQFTDRRTGVSAKALFPLFVQPLGFAGRDSAVIAVRNPGEGRMSIRAWAHADNTVREVVSIPYNARARFALGTDNTYTGGFVAWVNPAGRWLLLRTRPSNGSGVDLWLIDMKRGKAKIVYPNFQTFAASRATWLRNRAILSGAPPQILVDLPGGKAARYRPKWEDIR
ncbi:MAG: hypothetical protein IT209_10110 [Armatimonadetes bacterium]|nr:hypothetical protein [Armatimonadota bacterium]